MKIFKDPDMISLFDVLDFGVTVARCAALGMIVGGIVGAAMWFWR